MGGSSSKVPPVAVPTEEKGVQTAPHCGTHEEIMHEMDTILEMSLGRTVPPPTTATPPPPAASQTENLPEASPPPTGFFQPIPPTRVESHEHEVPRSMMRTVFGPIRFDISDDFQEARRQVDDLRSKIESLDGESRAAREDRRQQKRKAEESVQSQLSALQAGIESIQKTQEFREYRTDRRVRREQKRKAEESVQSQLSALQAGLESIQKNQERVLEALDEESRKRAKPIEMRLTELDIVGDVVNELMAIKEDLEDAVMNLRSRPLNQQPAETRPPIDAMVRGHHALNLNIPSPHYHSINASKGPIYMHDIEDAHRRGGMVPASPIAEAAGPCKHGSMHTFDTSCLLSTVPSSPSSESRGNTTATASDSASPSSSTETPIPRFNYGGFRDDSPAGVPESPIQLDYNS